MFKYLWNPFKWLGSRLQFLHSSVAVIIVTAIGIAGLTISILRSEPAISDPPAISAILLAVALAVILFSFSYRGSALKAWWYLLLSHVFIIAGININTEHINSLEIIFYTSGIGIAFLLGWYCLGKIKSIDNDIALSNHHGYVYEKKNAALLFLLASIVIELAAIRIFLRIFLGPHKKLSHPVAFR
jgi:hypothetical protein